MTTWRPVRWLLAWLIVLAARPAPASADVPQLIAYQGRLTEEDGQPLIGEHVINFRLYQADRGGDKLWEEAHRLTLAFGDNGVFSVVLGSLKPLTPEIFTRALWLGLEVDHDGEMTPRLRMTASGYAITADTLDGLDSRQFLRADTGSVGQGQLVLTNPGRALLIRPATPVRPDASLLEVQHPEGQRRFNVEADGDVTIGGNLTVEGSVRGGGIGAAALALEPGAGLSTGGKGLSLLRSCAEGQVLKWRADASAWACAPDATASGAGASGAKSSVSAGNTVAIAPTTETELLSLRLTKTRADSALWIVATIQLSHDGGSDATVDLTLMRDGASVETIRARIGEGAGAVAQLPVTLQGWDASATGSHTLRVVARAGTSSAQAGSRRLTVVEVP